VRNHRLESVYVGPEAVPAPVSVRWSIFDNNTGRHQRLPGAESFELPQVTGPVEFLMAELSAAQGPSIHVYVRVAPGRTVVTGVERYFAADRRN
jgi:hypothetical protein